MEFGVLGPLEVVEGDHRYSLGGPKQRAVLALLIAHAGLPVATGTLIDSLYGDEAPDRAHRSIHTFVSNLRSELGEVIERVGEGYSFVADRMSIDVIRFEDGVAKAIELDEPAAAAAAFREALGLWRGLPYSDIDVYYGLSAEITRLNELRITAIDRRIDAELADGRHDSLVAELESLVVEYPLRESFWAQRMVALYRSGRQAEALRSYSRARTQLLEETGLDPSPELQDLERRILEHDASLQLAARPSIQKAVILAADVADLAALTRSEPGERDELVAVQGRIVTNAVVDRNGEVFGHRGSAMYALFDGVDDAAAAAADAQTRLASDGRPMRMAISFGEVEIRPGGEALGPPVNRAAALVGAAHGGQVLLAADAHRELTDTGEAGWVIRSLGPHSFPGMPDPIAVHQLVVSGLPDSLPPLRMNELPPPIPGSGLGLPGYELREEVGSGVFGVVHRAYQPSVGREVAIKIIRPELANHPEFIRRFEVEAQLVARLEHPHIVPLHDYWREPDGAFLVMRWLRGGGLDKRLKGGPLGVSDVQSVLAQIVPALDHAHRQGVVHRDLKPSNVLFDLDGNAYLTDFGVAKRVDTANPLGIGHDVRGVALLVARCLEGATVTDEVGRFLTEAVEGRYATLASLLAAWEVAVGESNPATEEIRFTPTRNPYKGLRAFGELDAADFYGRADEVEQLVSAVGANRLVAVVGPSGVGKSSVVRAGLLPALRSGTISGSGEWFVADLVPGAQPYEELAAALFRVATQPSVDLEDELRRDERGLIRAVKRHLPDGAVLLLVVDQFEELFTLVAEEDERAAFLRLLQAAVTDERSNIRVVVTMRADFFDRPLRFGDFGELLRASTVPIASPNGAAMREIVSQPAAGVGVLFESGLVARITHDVHDQPGALPLVEFSLTELFDGRETDELSTAAYEVSGGVLGALGRRAEDIYGRLDPAGRDAARQIFLRLVNVRESGGDTRRRVRLRELEQLGDSSDNLSALLDAFGRHRLLTFDSDPVTRGPTVEVAHEAILTKWPRLEEWVADLRQDLLLHSRLSAAVSEWEASGRADTYLLGSGRLDHHESWSANSQVSLTSSEREFLELSRDEDDRQRSRRRTVRRRVLAGFAGAALIAAAFSVFATLQRNDAAQARDVATARELAAQATAQMDVNPEQGVLLALEAVEIGRRAGTDPLESTTALREALAAHRLEDRFDGGFFVAASADGNSIASGTTAGEVMVRRLDTGQVVTLERRGASATGAAFSPQDGLLAVTYAALEEPLWIWDVEMGTSRQFEGPEITGNLLPHHIAFSEHGDLVATLLSDGLHVWSTDTGAREHLIELTDVWSAFVPGTSHLLLADYPDSSIRTFDLVTGELIRKFPVLGSPGSIAVSPDGELVVGTYQDEAAVVVYEVDTGNQVWRTTLDRPAGVDWFSDGSEIAVGGEGAQITILDGTTGEIRQVLSGGHLGGVWSVATIPGGELLVSSGNSDGTTLLWNTTPGPIAEIARFDPGAHQARFVEYAPFPTHVFVSDLGPPPAARILDVSTMETVFEAESPDVLSNGPTAIVGDGSLLLVQSTDGTSAVWDLATGESVFTAPAGMFVRTGSHDGTRLLTVAHHSGSPEPYESHIVDVGSGFVVAVIDEPIPLPSFSYDGRFVFDWGQGALRLFSTSDGEVVLSLPGVKSIRPMPDGATVSIVDEDGTLWHANLEQLIAGSTIAEASEWSAFATRANLVPRGHVANQDGLLVATMARPQEPAKIWDTTTGTQIASLDPQLASTPPYVFFHQDEPYVTLASEGGVLLTYTLDIDELIAIAETRVTRSLTDAECQTFRHMDTCPS